MKVPFFRPPIGQAEIDDVVAVLRSDWLTTGPVVQRFENLFAAAVGAQNVVAVNSCTAAMHLAVEALGLGVGDAVLVPTMTFAATAEVVSIESTSRRVDTVSAMASGSAITPPRSVSGGVGLLPARRRPTPLRVASSSTASR